MIFSFTLSVRDHHTVKHASAGYRELTSASHTLVKHWWKSLNWFKQIREICIIHDDCATASPLFLTHSAQTCWSWIEPTATSRSDNPVIINSFWEINHIFNGKKKIRKKKKEDKEEGKHCPWSNLSHPPATHPTPPAHSYRDNQPTATRIIIRKVRDIWVRQRTGNEFVANMGKFVSSSN